MTHAPCLGGFGGTQSVGRGQKRGIIPLRWRINIDRLFSAMRNSRHFEKVTILGDEKCIWSGHPFPHSTNSIFLLRRDRKGTFKTFPSSFKTFSRTTIENVREEEEEYTAVLVPSKGQQKFQGEFYGPLKTKVKELKLLGYKPVVIFWPDYYRMFKARKNLNYLRELIKYKIKK